MSPAWLALIAAGAFLAGLMTVVVLEIQTGWIWRRYTTRRAARLSDPPGRIEP
jgi:hypothetical protein